jgi:serine/threonine protein kinase
MPQAVCPNREELARFLFGRLSEPDTQRIQQHLADCALCLTKVQAIDASDTLVDAMRTPVQEVAPTDAQAIGRLLSHARRLPGGDPTPVPADSSGQAAATFEFLAPAETPDELGRLGGYRVLDVLGAGGMGIVFRAEDPQLKRQVALKVMKPSLAASEAERARFLREAQSTAALEHDQIVVIHQVGEDRGVPFLAMPLLHGETLDSRLRRERVLSLETALRIGRQIADGLRVAHEHGLTHRDIKPANIWLEGKDEGGTMKDEQESPSISSLLGSSFTLHPSSFRIKILDFGLARPSQDDSHLTQTGVVAGTPLYMAPEQGAGEAIDHRSDLFSLGSVLYRMVTGQPPFAGKNTLAVLRALAVESPKPPRELNAAVPAALSDLILRLLAKKPEDRPQSAREVIAAISEIEQARSQQPRARRKGLLLAAALTAVALGASAWFYGPVVYRFATNQGVLIIETTDPDVEVTVKRNGEQIRILDVRTGHELTLIAGKYELALSEVKGGLRLSTDHFTLTRGGQAVVKILFKPVETTPPVAVLNGAGQQPPSPAATAPASANMTPPADPFVILARGNRAEQSFVGLADAVAVASGDDTIEIRGNGPFTLTHLDIVASLTLRAAAGFHPVFLCTPAPKQNEIIYVHAPLVMEGLELRLDSPGSASLSIVVASDQLHVANCRFLLQGGGTAMQVTAANCVVRSCQFAAAGRTFASFLYWHSKSSGRLRVHGCLLAQETPQAHVLIRHDHSGQVLQFDLSRSTLRGGSPISVYTHRSIPLEAEAENAGSDVVVEAIGNVIQSYRTLLFGSVNKQMSPEEAALHLRRTVTWRERRNLFIPTPASSRLAYSRQGEKASFFADMLNVRTLAEWEQFWGLADTGSLVGNVRFAASNPAPFSPAWLPANFTTDDYRLHADSPGKSAGEDGHDLGADVDLVGPGEAYERCKKSPEYQQWLRDVKP